MASNNNNKGNHNGDSSTGKTLFGNVDFEEDNKVVIRRILERKMQPEHLSTRVGAGRTTFTYIESWKAIELANGIFGFDGWSSSITDMILDFIEPVCGGARFKCGVTAIVRVTLKNGSFHEDVGFGIGENKCKGTALEKAKKEAVSDARKRALRLFGNALGNSVYDKEFIESIDVPTKKQPGRMGNQQSSYASPITYDGIRQSERSFSSPISRNGLPLPSPPPPLPPPSNSSNSNPPLNQPQQQVHNQQQMSPQGNQLYYQQHQHQQSPPQHLKSKVQIQGPPLTSPQHPSTTGVSTSSTSTASGLQQYQKDNNSNNVNNVNNVINISSNENSFDMTSGTANENENENDDASFLDGFDLSQIGRELSDDAIDKQPQQEQPQLSNGQNISPIQRKQPPPQQQQQQQQQQSNNNNNNNNGEEIDDDADLFGKIDLDDVMLFDDDDDNNNNNNNINKGSDDKQKTPSPQANLSGNDTVLVPESTKHHSQEQKHQQQLSPGMPPKVNISQIDQVKRNLFMPGPQSPQNKGFNNNNVGNVGNVGSSRNQYSSPPQSTTTTTTTTSSYSPVVAKNYSKPPPSKRFTIFVGKK